MDKIVYSLLRAASWIGHVLPMRLNYIFSDFLFLITYYIVGYRKKVVTRNLRNSFPEKSEKELKVIEKRFYHHFCDTFIETLYFDRISEKEIKKRANFINPELVNKYLDQGRPVVGYIGHYNNWEWLCNWPLYTNHRFYPIYKKLRSKAFGRFYYNLRGRFGAVPLERADTFRQLMEDSQKSIPSFTAFIADQTPRINDIQYWTTFLNQNTPVVVGLEKIARKLNAVVIAAHPKKIRRGYYEIAFYLVTENAKETSKFEITEKCTRFLEKIIIEKPEYWLWSHKRWKHKKPIKN
jgi:Kdo2-lipid IVA lauroyltransferase/acyltransferase